MIYTAAEYNITCTLWELWHSGILLYNYSTVAYIAISYCTIGTQLAALCMEVSLIQSYICTQHYVVVTAGSVLISEMSFINSDSSERFVRNNWNKKHVSYVVVMQKDQVQQQNTS